MELSPKNMRKAFSYASWENSSSKSKSAGSRLYTDAQIWVLIYVLATSQRSQLIVGHSSSGELCYNIWSQKSLRRVFNTTPNWPCWLRTAEGINSEVHLCILSSLSSFFFFASLCLYVPRGDARVKSRAVRFSLAPQDLHPLAWPDNSCAWFCLTNVVCSRAPHPQHHVHLSVAFRRRKRLMLLCHCLICLTRRSSHRWTTLKGMSAKAYVKMINGHGFVRIVCVQVFLSIMYLQNQFPWIATLKSHILSYFDQNFPN